MTKTWLTGLAVIALTAIAAFAIYQWRTRTEAFSVSGRKILYYRDPMHPAYTSDRPGKAPDCGMELEAVYADSGRSYQKVQKTGAASVITVSREQQQMLGLQLVKVESSAATGTIRTLGRVMVEEDRVFPVTAGGEGWITQLAPATATGDLVKKKQVLATVYGREYATAERTFLYALRGLETSRNANVGDYQDQPAVVLQEARLVLQNMGFGDEQVEQLTKTRQVILDIKLTSPADGVILARNAFLQRKFERGTELFRIADLTRVWISADLFGDDASRIRDGATATVSVPDRPGTKLRATVSDSLSKFDEQSRTLKLRLEAQNPGLFLRPEMFVNVELSVRLPRGLTVPAESIVTSESHQLVFVEQKPGLFERRAVETGWRVGGRVQVLEGLKPDELIASSGSFFLDSEDRMRASDLNGHD
jgi:membrane fusion protein, copper/silver efflux system